MICDDCEQEIKDISLKCQLFLDSRNIRAGIKGCSNPLELDIKDIDILLLDVKMPAISGIDIKNKLELSRKNKPLIIFITGYPQYSISTHGKNVIGFLEKPLDEIQLYKMLDKCMFLLEDERTVILGNEEVYKLSDIEYFFMDKGYTKAVMCNGVKSSGILKSLSEWEDELKDEWFIRINRSYLVNFKFIIAVKKDVVKMSDGAELKISRNNLNLFALKYLEYRENCARYT